jgi:cation:H+ antiporter
VVLNLLVFTAAAAVIWAAGTRLSRYADELADRTGIGTAFIGVLLLGGVTSLPEAATTVTASAIGNAPLAVNNILGGVAMQVVVLAVADMVAPGRPITFRTGKAVVLLEAALLILILTIAAIGIAVGDTLVIGVGLWSTAILASSLAAYFLIHQHTQRKTWEPQVRPSAAGRRPTSADRARRDAVRRHSMRRLTLSTAIAGTAILAGGIVVARAGDALAAETGLDASLIGMVLLAGATSLPEISTTIGAVRLGQFVMAFSGIFGANILDLSILFLADVAFPGGPVLNSVGRFSLLAALLAVLLTSVYMVGLLDRRKRLVLGMGIDSLTVLLLYGGGLLLLYAYGSSSA